MNPRVVLDASPTYGVSFGMRLMNEDDLVEMRWARQDSYVHGEDITPQPDEKQCVWDSLTLKSGSKVKDGYARKLLKMRQETVGRL